MRIARTRAPELVGAGGWIGVDRPLTLRHHLRGKVVVLEFWTLACINCLRLLDVLRPIERRFRDELVVIGVHSPKFPHERDHEAVSQAVDRHRVPHPVLDDPGRETWSRYGVRAWPTVVVVSPDGYVVGMRSGEGVGPELEQLVAELVAEHEETGTLSREPVPALEQRSPDDTAEESPLRFPGKVAGDGEARIAIADTANDRVLVIDPLGRVVHQLDRIREPQGVRFDLEAGEVLLVCETGADRVLRIDLATGERRVLVDGIASPWDVLVDGSGAGATYVIAEAGRHRLWRCRRDGSGAAASVGDGTEGLRDGPAHTAHLAQPSGLARASVGVVFVDPEASALRVLRDDGEVETWVGTGLFAWGAEDGPGERARLQHPLGVAVRPAGHGFGEAVYVADTFNGRLRVWRDGQLATLAIGGLVEPGGIDVLPDGRLLVADTGNHRVLVIDPGVGTAEPLPIRFRRRTGPWFEGGDPLELVTGDASRVPFSIDVTDPLDRAAGAPVRVTVSSDPPGLLASGSGTHRFDDTSGVLDLRAGDPGSGLLIVEVVAATCHDGVCRVHEHRTGYPLAVRSG